MLINFKLMEKLQKINRFLEKKNLAIAGVSRNHNNFGYSVYQTLKEKGFNIYPVNPNSQKIDGFKCYKNVDSLPSEVESLLIVTNPTITPWIIDQAIKKGIKHIWIQQKSEDKEIIKRFRSSNAEIIYNQCILMFADPSGFHKFHKTIKGIFGFLPK